MLWWLDFRGEWRGCSRIGWLLCRNGCISECCHEIGLYCVRWSSGRVVLTWSRCWPLHHTGGAYSKTGASAVCRYVANFKRIDVFWLSQWTVIISDRRSPGMLRGVGWQLPADVSGQRICPIFKCPAVQEVDCWTLEDSIDRQSSFRTVWNLKIEANRLARNVYIDLWAYAAQHPWRARA